MGLGRERAGRRAKAGGSGARADGAGRGTPGRDRLAAVTQARSEGPVVTPPLTATLRRVERPAGALATASVARMDETLPWFRALPADQRSWVMLVAQAGVRSLVEWLRTGGTAEGSTQEISDEVFAAAPRALARSIS